MKVERSKEWWLAKARQETGAVGAGMSLAGCGVCPICKHLWELYPDGKLPVHSGDDLMGCAGSRQQPMPQCSRCGQYEMNHERHGSPGCPGVYPAVVADSPKPLRPLADETTEKE